MNRLILLLAIFIPTLSWGQPLDSRIPYGKGQTSFVATNSGDTPIEDDVAEVLISGVAGTQLFITEIGVTNMDASVATAVFFAEQGGSNTLWACPGGVAGGGCTISFSPPLPVTLGAGINCTAEVTGAYVYCFVKGIKVAL